MEGHTSFPHPQQPQGIGEEAVEVIKKDRAKSPANYRAHRPIENEIGDLLVTKAALQAPSTVEREPPDTGKGDNIHKPIPMN